MSCFSLPNQEGGLLTLPFTPTRSLQVPTSTAAVKQEPLPSNIDPIPPPSQPPASRLAPSTVNDRPPGWRQASASGGEADGRSGPPSSHAPSPSPSHWSPTKTYARPKWINDALSHREADRSRVPSAGSKRPAASDRYEWWDDGSAGYGSSADRRGSADAPGGGAGWSAPRERERDDPRKRPRTDGRPVVDAWVGHVPPPRASGGAGPSTGPPALSSTGQIRKGHCVRRFFPLAPPRCERLAADVTPYLLAVPLRLQRPVRFPSSPPPFPFTRTS